MMLEVLIFYHHILKRKNINCHYLLSGPAIEIFRSKLKDINKEKKFFE